MKAIKYTARIVLNGVVIISIFILARYVFLIVAPICEELLNRSFLSSVVEIYKYETNNNNNENVCKIKN